MPQSPAYSTAKHLDHLLILPRDQRATHRHVLQMKPLRQLRREAMLERIHQIPHRPIIPYQDRHRFNANSSSSTTACFLIVLYVLSPRLNPSPPSHPVNPSPQANASPQRTHDAHVVPAVAPPKDLRRLRRPRCRSPKGPTTPTSSPLSLPQRTYDAHVVPAVAPPKDLRRLRRPRCRTATVYPPVGQT